MDQYNKNGHFSFILLNKKNKLKVKVSIQSVKILGDWRINEQMKMGKVNK